MICLIVWLGKTYPRIWSAGGIDLRLYPLKWFTVRRKTIESSFLHFHRIRVISPFWTKTPCKVVHNRKQLTAKVTLDIIVMSCFIFRKERLPINSKDKWMLERKWQRWFCPSSVSSSSVGSRGTSTPCGITSTLVSTTSSGTSSRSSVSACHSSTRASILSLCISWASSSDCTTIGICSVAALSKLVRRGRRIIRPCISTPVQYVERVLPWLCCHHKQFVKWNQEQRSRFRFFNHTHSWGFPKNS